MGNGKKNQGKRNQGKKATAAGGANPRTAPDAGNDGAPSSEEQLILQLSETSDPKSVLKVTASPQPGDDGNYTITMTLAHCWKQDHPKPGALACGDPDTTLND